MSRCNRRYLCECKACLSAPQPRAAASPIYRGPRAVCAQWHPQAYLGVASRGVPRPATPELRKCQLSSSTGSAVIAWASLATRFSLSSMSASTGARRVSAAACEGTEAREVSIPGMWSPGSACLVHRAAWQEHTASCCTATTSAGQCGSVRGRWRGRGEGVGTGVAGLRNLAS